MGKQIKNKSKNKEKEMYLFVGFLCCIAPFLLGMALSFTRGTSPYWAFPYTILIFIPFLCVGVWIGLKLQNSL